MGIDTREGETSIINRNFKQGRGEKRGPEAVWNILI
jgi:hypothetical protein